jgi:hypothetical protein
LFVLIGVAPWNQILNIRGGARALLARKVLPEG